MLRPIRPPQIQKARFAASFSRFRWIPDPTPNGRVTFYQVQFGHNSYDGGALPPVSMFLIASAVDPSSSSHNSKCSIMRRSLLLIHDMYGMGMEWSCLSY